MADMAGPYLYYTGNLIYVYLYIYIYICYSFFKQICYSIIINISIKWLISVEGIDHAQAQVDY